MKIAVLSDIHGYSLALDAVLQDADKIGVDEYVVLGDIVAIGPDPIGVLDRLSALKNCSFIRGNTDRYVITGDRPPPFPEHLGADPEQIRIFAEVAGTFAWTQGAITVGGWFDWLSALPLDLEKTLPDGTKCLFVHARPGDDDGIGFNQDQTDPQMVELLEGCTADMICVGHTHQRVNRKVGRWHVVNPGSIGNPRQPILQASYAVIDASAKGYQIEFRLADYDREKVIAQVQALNHPGGDFIIQHLRGLIN